MENAEEDRLRSVIINLYRKIKETKLPLWVQKIADPDENPFLHQTSSALGNYNELLKLKQKNPEFSVLINHYLCDD